VLALVVVGIRTSRQRNRHGAWRFDLQGALAEGVMRR
jgi:hypothetical protein